MLLDKRTCFPSFLCWNTSFNWLLSPPTAFLLERWSSLTRNGRMNKKSTVMQIEPVAIAGSTKFLDSSGGLMLDWRSHRTSFQQLWALSRNEHRYAVVTTNSTLDSTWNRRVHGRFRFIQFMSISCLNSDPASRAKCQARNRHPEPSWPQLWPDLDDVGTMESTAWWRNLFLLQRGHKVGMCYFFPRVTMIWIAGVSRGDLAKLLVEKIRINVPCLLACRPVAPLLVETVD